VPKPTLDEIKARANYCTWHTAHGKDDIPTLIAVIEKAQKGQEGAKRDAKRNAERMEQAVAEHTAVVRQKAVLVKEVEGLQAKLDILNGAQAEVGRLRDVLDHIKETADYPR